MAGETGTGNRIVFAAVVAFTGRRTPDGRVIEPPEGFRCPTAKLPLPVYGWEPDDHGNMFAVRVGQIDEAYVIENRMTVFGHMDFTELGRKYAALLNEGSHFLEIDLDDIQYEMDGIAWTRKPGEIVTSSPDMKITSWRLAAAHIGTSPSWDLPPVQIEELNS